MKLLTKISVMLMMFASKCLLAVTYYVDETNGSDSNDGLSESSPLQYLTTASAKTQPGDTVKILPGVYRDMGAANAFAGLYVVNSGQPGNYITYSGVPDVEGNLPVIESSALSAFAIQTKAYIIVEDLEFKGADEDYLDIQNTIGTWAWESRSGVRLQDNSHNIIVRNCNIHDFPGGGIEVSGCDVVLVEGNTVEHNAWGSNYGQSGISCYKMEDTPSAVRFPEYPNHDVIIKDNVSRYNINLRGTAAFDFSLTDGNGIIVDDFKNTQGEEGEPSYSGSSLIVGNITYGNGATGINVFQTENVEVINNTVFDNGQSRRTESKPSDLVLNQSHQPIQVGGSANTTVKNNIFVRADNTASMISRFWNDEETITIEDNIFWNTIGGIEGVPEGNIIADPRFANAISLTQEQTNLLGTVQNIYVVLGDSASVRLPTVNNGFPVHDFSLQESSPAIDAGVDSVHRDFLGSATDIGALESDPESFGPALVDEIKGFTLPYVFVPGETNVITVDYSATESRDLIVILADGNNNYSWVVFTSVTLPEGEGSVDVNLPVNASATMHDNYKLELILTTLGGYHADSFVIVSEGNVTVGEAVEEEPEIVVDELSSVSLESNSFTAGSSNIVTIDYQATEERDIMIILGDANDNYSWQAFRIVTVPAGANTIDVDLNVSPTAASHSNYKFEIILTTVGGYHSGELDSIVTSGNTVQ